MPDKIVYMDNNATTPVHPRVKQVLTETLDIYGNASSFHAFGREARARIEAARESVASFINADADELIFVGSGSEANNTVLNIFSWTCEKAHFPFHEHKEIITSQIEHPCIMETSQCLMGRGTPVRYIGVDADAKLDMQELEDTISGETGLVSIMMANNEVGTIQDIKEVARIAHDKGVLVHTDAVQALGKIPVDVKDLGVDFLSLSGHKVYGPKGVGALYIKKGTPFCPLIRGGHQEQGRRAGTENTLGIIGFGAAVDMLRQEIEPEAKRLLELKMRLRKGIEGRIPDVRVNGHQDDCLPGTLNVSFAGAEGEAILLYLDLEGIGVSTGSACSSGSLDPSHVLLATGLEAEQAHGSIRFSLGRENTQEDVDYVLEKLPQVIQKIRGMSTAYKGNK
jgi:cysteine desulfurase